MVLLNNSNFVLEPYNRNFVFLDKKFLCKSYTSQEQSVNDLTKRIFDKKKNFYFLEIEQDTYILLYYTILYYLTTTMLQSAVLKSLKISQLKLNIFLLYCEVNQFTLKFTPK